MNDEDGSRERTSRAGPAGMVLAELVLLAVLALTVGLGWAGWAAGAVCVVATGVAVVGLARRSADPIGPATCVTLGRAALAVGVGALTAEAFTRDVSVPLVVALAVAALVTDAIDGRVARRTCSTSALGARLDGEVDAFLMLVLSVYVARSAGVWVLAIGLARYVFFAAGWGWRWMRARLPARDWRKVVTATQGIVLTVAAADVLPRIVSQIALVGALALLAESFGRDVWWLWSHRDDAGSRAAVDVERTPGQARRALTWALTALSLVLVWVALVAPNRLSQLTPSSFVRVPLEGLVVLGLAIALPASKRRLLAWVVGGALGLVLLVKLLDMGFYASLDRPFDPVDDWSYAGIGVETLRDSIGAWRANVAVAGVVVLVLAVLTLTPLALVRLVRDAARRPRLSLRVVGALGLVWVGAWVLGAPAASTSAATVAVDQAQAVRAGLRDYALFPRELRQDRFKDTPGDRLLTGLRGKDVLLVFVESYGRVALENETLAPRVSAVLDTGSAQLRAAGYSSRSAWLTSSTFGGISWLAHATVQAGVWVDSERRYDRVVGSDRFTLSKAFARAGWRTVADVPSNDREWPEGTTFYGYDQIYDQRNLGYRGPRFGYPAMPDQYTLAALHRFELARRNRAPLFAEVDLVSSHIPWTRIPRLIDWGEVGDGSIYHRIAADESSKTAIFGDRDRARAAYGRSLEYSLNSVFSFVQRYGDDDLVLVVVGDHQPGTVITGEDASRDVPISVIARDPKVFDQIAGWGWQDGMRPGASAPLWRMDSFRDRFLSAFGSEPAPDR